MQPPDPRLTVLEALLALFAAVFGMIVGGGILFTLLGIWALPIVQLLFIAGPVLIACIGRGSLIQAPRLLGVHPVAPRAALGAVLVGATFWFIQVVALMPIADRWLGGRETSEMLKEALLPPDVPLAVVVLMASLFPAVCEELLFRGALLRALRRRMSAAGAVAVSAFFFAVFHIHPAQILPNLVFGALLAVAVLATGSVVTSMIIHAVHNAVVLLVAAEVWPGLEDALENQPLVALGIAALTTTLGIALVTATGRSGRKRVQDPANRESS